MGIYFWFFFWGVGVIAVFFFISYFSLLINSNWNSQAMENFFFFWQVGRVFVNVSGDWVQSQVESYQRPKKWYLMSPCLTLSIEKIGIKGKGKQSRKRSGAYFLHFGVVAKEKGAFASLSTNFTFSFFLS